MIERASTPNQLAKIFVGPAGWSYPDWDGIVYPAHHSRDFDPAAFLAYSYFDVIEINTVSSTSLCGPRSRRDGGGTNRRASTLSVHRQAVAPRFTHETGASAADERAVREGFAPLVAAGRLAAVLLQNSLFPFTARRKT